MNTINRLLGTFSELFSLRWLVSLCLLVRLRLDTWERDKRHPGSKRDRKRSPYPCVPINRPEFLRPDPLIYSQYFLMAQGMAVTWDNPDIVLERDGVIVPSSALEPNTTYDVIARVWNSSVTCPVVSMPVHLSYLSFGVQTKSTPVGKTWIDLGVKGGPSCPAFARFQWTTPHEGGHYCLQILLTPADDLNSLNNVGQENTRVVEARSPGEFAFALRNGTGHQERFRFEVDTYELPAPVPCDSAPARTLERARRPIMSGPVDYKQQAFRARTHPDDSRIARHRHGNHPLPPEWSVDLVPEFPSLAFDEEITIKVVLRPPDGFRGRQRINVNTIAGATLAGGVTVTFVAH